MAFSPRFGRLLISLSLLVQSAFAQMSISNSTVTVRGVTPRADVLIFGMSMEPFGYESRVTKSLVIVTDDDGDGTVTYAPSSKIDTRSVWFAVDMQAGKLLSAKPPGSPSRIFDLLKEGGAAPSVGSARLTRQFTDFLDAVLVRPGVGAWTLTAGDGGPNDDDRSSDYAVTLSLPKFGAVTKKGKPPVASPPALIGGDVLLAIEPRTLKAYTLTLPCPRSIRRKEFACAAAFSQSSSSPLLFSRRNIRISRRASPQISFMTFNR